MLVVEEVVGTGEVVNVEFFLESSTVQTKGTGALSVITALRKSET